MKVYLDHDRSPVGITILHQSTFFGREIALPDSLAGRMEKILDAASELRVRLARIYEQPDMRIREAVTQTLIEDMIKICDGVKLDETPKPQAIEVPLKKRSRSQQKRMASQQGTNQKTE